MTTVPVSTVPAVKAYLLGALKVRSDLADLAEAIQYGPPTTAMNDDMILLDAARGAFEVDRMVGGGGQWWMDESYSLDILIWIHRGDDDPQACEERAFAVAASVVDTLRQDPSLGGLVTQASPAGFEMDGDWDDEHLGRHVKFALTVAIEATQ